MNKLEQYGANEKVFAEASLFPELYPARVASQYKDIYKIVTLECECLAEVSGKFMYNANDNSDFPVVGDFVMVDRINNETGNAIIHNILSRKTVFERRAVGNTNHSQPIASNVEIIFICMALNNDYNLSRLERYISIAQSSGATPVIILTKSDLCDDIDEVLREINTIAIAIDIIITSAYKEDSYNELFSYLKEGVTASFIGSSGIGKSTLINKLIGDEILLTSETRSDDKGRHTTTRRELILLPNGSIVIDTPGMRELGVETVDLSKSFVDIDELIVNCKFSDCTHTNEPDCAVKKAIDEGLLTQRRFENYLKLKKEAKYDGLNSKQIETEKLNSMFKEFGGIKNAKKMLKDKNRQKFR